MVKNTRYPEGSIAEQYLVHECIGYCKLYLTDEEDQTDVAPDFNISIYSSLVKPSSFLRRTRLSRVEIDLAHWCVLQNCEEARYFIDVHEQKYYEEFPYGTNEERIAQFPKYFKHWIDGLEGTSPLYSKAGPLYSLACEPFAHTCYSKCEVNGVTFVAWEQDQTRQTQNSGLMVDAGGMNYYGILEQVIELKYSLDMPVVLFKCRWFNTYDPMENATLHTDRYGIISVDTFGNYYQDSPYCLATTARQVFYLEDPVLGDNWKVVNVVSHRGIYSDIALGRRDVYQEEAPGTIPTHNPLDESDDDLGDHLPYYAPHDYGFANDDDGSHDNYAEYDEDDEDDEEGEDESDDD